MSAKHEGARHVEAFVDDLATTHFDAIEAAFARITEGPHDFERGIVWEAMRRRLAKKWGDRDPNELETAFPKETRGGFVYQLTLNIAKDHRRADERRKRRELLEGDLPRDHDGLTPLQLAGCDPHADAEARAEEEERRTRLQVLWPRVVAELKSVCSGRQRETITRKLEILLYLQGASNKDAAIKFGVSPGRISQIHKEMMKLLKDKVRPRLEARGEGLWCEA